MTLVSGDRKARLMEKWGNCGVMARILYVLIGYFILKKVDPKFLIPIVVVSLLLLELGFRFGIDCILMLVNWYYDKKDRNETLFYGLSMIYVAIFFALAACIYIGCVGIVAYEVSKYGSRLMAELGDYGDEIAMDRIKSMIGTEKFKHELQEESWEDLVFEYSDLECSHLINYLESVPFLYKQASYLDDMLVDFNYSTGKLGDFAYQYRD